MVKGFQAVRKDMLTGSSRGIGILIRENIVVKEIDVSHLHHDSIEIQAIESQFNNEPLVIVNIYRHSNTVTPRKIIDNIFRLQEIYKHIIFIGDFNAHNVLWNSSYTDRSGTDIEELLELHKLAIANDGNITRFGPNQSCRSILDFSSRLVCFMASPRLRTAIQEVAIISLFEYNSTGN